MKINCPNCNKTLNVPDEKIPQDKDFKFKCPSCKSNVTVPTGGGAISADLPQFDGVPTSTPTSPSLLDETRQIQVPKAVPGALAPSLESMMGAIEDEMDILEEGSLRALVADPDNLELISPVLRKMNYLITSVKSSDEALSKLQFNFYDIILLNERFDGSDLKNNAVLQYIQPLSMDTRRRMFVALIGKNFKSMDNMTALTNSVNLVLSEADFSNFELIFKKAIKENEIFYRVFRKMLVNTGREIES
ncbi:hypothetical protein MNBD_NITROSPINAE01-1700 [hydrothermal vent metagenome]|uniref:Zinc finger/thioredoxin putative domain-containing protein n=1 Tax=hydrothermal vent metagenome TaxID=652676 RepID=A0A3B1C474_9ZZZZ